MLGKKRYPPNIHSLFPLVCDECGEEITTGDCWKKGCGVLERAKKAGAKEGA